MIKLELPIYASVSKKKNSFIIYELVSQRSFSDRKQSKEILSSTCVCFLEKRRQAQREN